MSADDDFSATKVFDILALYKSDYYYYYYVLPKCGTVRSTHFWEPHGDVVAVKNWTAKMCWIANNPAILLHMRKFMDNLVDSHDFAVKSKVK